MGALSSKKLFEAGMEAGDLQAALEHLRKAYRQAEDADRGYLETKGREIAARLAVIAAPPTLRALAEADRDGLLADLSLLILDVEEAFNLEQGLGVPQIEMLSDMICQRHKALSLEEVALCFHKAKCGEYGPVYGRLAVNVVNEWLNKYAKERLEMQAQHIQNQYLQHKAGGGYEPGLRHSVAAAERERAIDPDRETYYQAVRGEYLDKKKQALAVAKKRLERKKNRHERK